MSSPLPSSASFGDQFLCPVCFEVFNGRILQCSQGHSVCESCVKKIMKNECPQCRGAFVGTRNYVLEEMIKQLKQLKDSVMVKKSDTNNDTNSNTESNEHDSDEDVDNTKLTEAIAKLVLSIPKISKYDNSSEQLDSPRRTTATTSASPVTAEAQSESYAPPQPRGTFTCRMGNCVEKVPVCRMLNHIRSFHIRFLTQYRLQNNEDEFIMHYTFKCDKFRQFIHISQYGLFFLIVNVKRDSSKTVITSWIQCVGRGTECNMFTFNLQMRINNAIAHFTDYTYGETSDANYIESKKQCLYYETATTARRFKEISADVKIYKTNGERTGRRRTTTTVVPISN